MGYWDSSDLLLFNLKSGDLQNTFSFKQIGDDEDAEAVQLHYFERLTAQGLGTSHHRGRLPKSDPADEAWLAFLPHAKKRLADAGWARVFDDGVKTMPDTGN